MWRREIRVSRVSCFLYALSGEVVWVDEPNILYSYRLFDVMKTFQPRYIYIYSFEFYDANGLYMMIFVMCFQFTCNVQFFFSCILSVG
jgi:hypothetical protein